MTSAWDYESCFSSSNTHSQITRKKWLGKSFKVFLFLFFVQWKMIERNIIILDLRLSFGIIGKFFFFLCFSFWRKTSNEANFWSDLIAHSKIAQVSSEMHHIICWIIKYWCLENSKENTILRCRLKVCEWSFLQHLKFYFSFQTFNPIWIEELLHGKICIGYIIKWS